MTTIGQTINVLALLSLGGLTWWVPRRLGLMGMFGVQILVGLGFLGMGAVAQATGVWGQYEPESLVGLLLQAVAFNALLLPLSGIALWRHSRAAAHKRRMQLADQQCAGCGYDLRASKDRCPECGTLVRPSEDERAYRP
jgi:predicted RNA-binding Zn-ribbon protein involved in translation (DUF1610 family)